MAQNWGKWLSLCLLDRKRGDLSGPKPETMWTWRGIKYAPLNLQSRLIGLLSIAPDSVPSHADAFLLRIR